MHELSIADRISIDMARDAYAATGLIPRACVIVDGNWACPIGACVVHLRPDKTRGRLVSLWHALAALGLPRWYGRGFTNGFDAERYPFRYPETPRDSEEYARGLEDGRRHRAEFLQSTT
jgi:hypothetical protein